MTHDQLEQYINSFREIQREEIAKHIIDSELLREAFETSAGRMILNSAVDLITSNVIQIVRYCSESPPNESITQIQPHAAEINTTHKLMTDWAKILIRGGEHKKKAEKLT